MLRNEIYIYNQWLRTLNYILYLIHKNVGMEIFKHIHYDLSKHKMLSSAVTRFAELWTKDFAGPRSRKKQIVDDFLFNSSTKFCPQT